jgi:hypothetical protein
MRAPALLLVLAAALGALGLGIRAAEGDEHARLRDAVRAYETASRAGRGFDNGVARAGIRARAQALLTEVAIGDDRAAAAHADVLLGILAARGGRSAAGETPDELSRSLFETAVRLDERNTAAKFDLELAVLRLRAVGVRSGAGQGSGPRGGGQRGAGAGLPGRGY